MRFALSMQVCFILLIFSSFCYLIFIHYISLLFWSRNSFSSSESESKPSLEILSKFVRIGLYSTGNKELSNYFGSKEIFFLVLEEMKTYKFEWNINQVVSGFDTYDLTFDLFKLEYVGDKKQETPSFYTKPGE
jgi:hypothetical protein